MITVTIIPILQDNYAFYIESPCGVSAVIDAGHAAQIDAFLTQNDKNPDYIISTHHHWDHTDGNLFIKEKYNTKLIVPVKEAQHITGYDDVLGDGDLFMLGDTRVNIIETAGHTIGGLCLYVPDSRALFTGDTLFSMGCGRLLEATAADMFASLQKLKTLPDETMIYCGHEYTKGNAGFCLSQDKTNPYLRERITEIKRLRQNNQPTIPVSLATEKKTNLFLMANTVEEFIALRQKKDNF